MNRPILLSLCLLLPSVTAVQAADPVLDPDAAFPVASASNPGFVVRTVQAPDGSLLDNNFLRAVKQLNGTLLDPGGVPYADVSVAGPDNGLYSFPTVDFTTEPEAGQQGYFPGDQQFPGTVAGGQRNLFSTEVITFLSLPQGSVKMGVTAAFTRTDELDDDGWRLYSAPNPRSYLGTLVGEYARTAPPFPDTPQELAGNTTEFNVTVPASGVYPFRLVYWQTDRRSMLEWYVVVHPGEPDEARQLIGTPESGISAYKTDSVPRTSAPYVAEVSPLPDSAGASPAAPIQVVLFDGANAINTATIKMTLNSAAVTPQSIVRDGKKVTVIHTPNASRTTALNVVGLEFKDTTGFLTTEAWKFTMTTAGAAAAPVTGQWDFDEGDLRATTGKPLGFFSALTATTTTFGTTQDLGIPDINGQPALVMHVPGNTDNTAKEIGYIMNHGIAPNGGGTRVNQYTLIMDVFVETTGASAASLLQTSSLTNSDDGDLFWQGNNFGQGAGGYNGTGAFTTGAWHRVSAAYDMAANPPVVTKFVDGIKQDDWTANQSLDNVRRSLLPTALLFADGDDGERRGMYVNSIQIRAGKLSDAQMVLLGGPDACGIPADLPVPLVAGQWDFERGDLSATVGKPLAYFDGAGGVTQSGTVFGTAQDLGISDIPGSTAAAPAKFMKVPGEKVNTIGYVMTHGIAPNGGGTLVNQYTLIMDIYVDPSVSGAASLLQIDSVTNTSNDGDLFWQNGNFGQGTGGYNGTGAFNAGAWHRICAAYDLAAHPPVVTKYVDGIKQDDWTTGQSLDNPRRALLPTAILFADGDADERGIMYVNSIQIRPRKLTDAEMVLLGGPHAYGIPVNIPASNVTGQWDFDRGNLAATIGKPLTYFDGPGGVTETGTQYGDTTALGVAQINGADAKIMVVPGETVREIGYVMDHGIAPNGGGTKVNQYTIIFDAMVDTVPNPPGAASMLQISSLNNMDDGDLFWQGNNFGQGTGGYNGTGAFTAGAWHRVCASYDMAAVPPVVTKVVDGVFQDSWTTGQSIDNPRRALQPTAILFADGDVPTVDERRKWWVNSVQIRSGALSAGDLMALGGPQASGIPVTIPGEPLPKLCFGRSGSKIVLFWPLSAVGWTLQSTTNLSAWTNVPGVTNNSYIADPATLGRKAWFRLAK